MPNESKQYFNEYEERVRNAETVLREYAITGELPKNWLTEGDGLYMDYWYQYYNFRDLPPDDVETIARLAAEKGWDQGLS